MKTEYKLKRRINHLKLYIFKLGKHIEMLAKANRKLRKIKNAI